MASHCPFDEVVDFVVQHGVVEQCRIEGLIPGGSRPQSAIMSLAITG